MGGAILVRGRASFLGLGVQPPTPSWGAMLNYGRAHVLDAPHLTVFPGLAIARRGAGIQFTGRRTARQRWMAADRNRAERSGHGLELQAMKLPAECFASRVLRSIAACPSRVAADGEVREGDAARLETARWRAEAPAPRLRCFPTATARDRTSSSASLVAFGWLGDRRERFDAPCSAPRDRRCVLCDLEPDPTERRVDNRRIGIALGGAAERQHRCIVASEARVGQTRRSRAVPAASVRAPTALRAARSPDAADPSRCRGSTSSSRGGCQRRLELEGSEQRALGLDRADAGREGTGRAGSAPAAADRRGSPLCAAASIACRDIAVAIVGKAQLVDTRARDRRGADCARSRRGRLRAGPSRHGHRRAVRAAAGAVGSSAAASVRSRTAEANSPRCR